MKKLLSILLILAIVFSLGATAFAEEEKKDDPDLKTFLSELAEKDKVTEEDLSELLTILGNRIAEEIGTGLSDAGMKHEITSAEYPLYNYSTSLGCDVKLYFLDGAADLPYIEANDFLPLLNDFILGSSEKGLCFTLEADGPVVTYIRQNPAENADDNGATMVLDFDRDTIDFVDYNLFCKDASGSTLLDMTRITVFNEEGEPAALQKLDQGTLTRYGHEVMLPLGDYGIDLVWQDGLYLIPLQTLSDFILTAPGSGFYFNGKNLMFAADTRLCPDFYYDAPTGERSEALAEYGYNELCLMLDYLYGMKDTHDIESFDQLFHDVGLQSLLKGTNAEYADRAIWHLITDFFDDIHSDWHAYSYLAGPVDVQVPNGPSVSRWIEKSDEYEAVRKKYYPDGVPGYEEIGNTAYITFDRFYIEGQDGDQFYHVEDPMDFEDTDTIGLIMKAHALINRENSPIENVVIDLSCNGGGHADTAIFVMAWFLGEASIGMKDMMTGAMCSSTYRCDANRDRKFDDSDTVKDKNLFCLISPVSFSCGNLVPCMFKESGKVTLIGRTSGGGACNVLPSCSAWGTSFQISAPRQLSFLKNGSFYNVDRGADPDYVLADLNEYYDREALTDYINSLYWASNAND